MCLYACLYMGTMPCMVHGWKLEDSNLQKVGSFTLCFLGSNSCLPDWQHTPVSTEPFISPVYYLFSLAFSMAHYSSIEVPQSIK